jgi:transposase InsO family protein
MCRVLGVSRSGYYAWAGRPASARAVANAGLVAAIRRVHAESDGTYGSRRVHAELRREGQEVNIKRVERLMRVEGIQGAYVPPKRRRGGDGVLGVDGVRVWPDLVKHDFQPDGPNQLWCSDRTSESKRVRSNGLRLSPSSTSGARHPAYLTFAGVSWRRKRAPARVALQSSRAAPVRSRAGSCALLTVRFPVVMGRWRRRQIESVAGRTVALGGPTRADLWRACPCVISPPPCGFAGSEKLLL